MHATLDLVHSKEEDDLPALSPQEVVRRLRLLGQPATLFGEVRRTPSIAQCRQHVILATQTDFDRLKRLKKAEQEVQLEDEAAGGGMQNNLALELQRKEAAEMEGKKRRALAAGHASKGEAEAKPAANQASQEDAPGDVRACAAV